MTGESLAIDRIVFIGRTYSEYMRMFDLDETIFEKGPVLDCPAGPSSFTAEARSRGFKAVACDLLYDVQERDLLKKGKEDLAHVYQKLDGVSHLYVWKHYKNRDEILALRRKALELFIDDYKSGRPDRYVRAELPHLPFPDKAFTVVLCSHFLFLYGDRLDFDFHKACLKEMARVSSGEVRVYPIQGLDARPYPRLEELLEFLADESISAEIVEVPFEFQRGAKTMLRLTVGERVWKKYAGSVGTSYGSGGPLKRRKYADCQDDDPIRKIAGIQESITGRRP